MRNRLIFDTEEAKNTPRFLGGLTLHLHYSRELEGWFLLDQGCYLLTLEDIENLYRQTREFAEKHPSSIEGNHAYYNAKYSMSERPIQTYQNSRDKEPGFVYIAYRASTGAYKIGLARNVEKRLRQIGDVELYHVISTNDMASTEASLHKQFAGQRINGEWFDLDADDLTNIVSKLDIYNYSPE